MNHVMIRRYALTSAAVSFGILAALLTVACVFSNYSRSQEMTRTQVLSASAKPVIAQKLPCEISCTSLLAESLAVYDGPFFEDGDPREVFHVAALKISNTGNTMIPYACITVTTPTTSYVFEGYLLLPGSSVLIPEKNAAKLTDKEVISCFGWSTVGHQSTQYGLCVTEALDGSVCVANRSMEDYQGIIMCYKTYLQEAQLYIGGKPFELRIPYISAGETVHITPEYYAPGYSSVLCWRVGILSGV